MKKVKFSVLMSVYYREKADNLKSSLESILNQTIPADEIILVEDGPLTKELYDVIREYKNKIHLFKTVSLKENMGLGKSLNEGLKHCKYKFVARMDTDDYALPYRFEKQIGFLSKNPEVAVLGGNIEEYDEKFEKMLSKKNMPLSTSDIISYAKYRNPFNHMTVIFNKDAVLKCGSYETMHFFEDYYLWCKLIAKNYIVRNLNEVLVKVRAGDSMIKRRGGIKYIKYIINFENGIKKLGIINTKEKLKNILIRTIISIMPVFIRKGIYKYKLRNK